MRVNFPGGLVVAKPGNLAYFDGLEGAFPVVVKAVRPGEVLIEGKSPGPYGASYDGWWPVRNVFPLRALYGRYQNRIAPYKWEARS